MKDSLQILQCHFTLTLHIKCPFSFENVLKIRILLFVVTGLNGIRRISKDLTLLLEPLPLFRLDTPFEV